ncbi:MAG: DUF1295 domain-containing protein [Acidobacteriota bacterium]|nr:DUF1295 domain-containing protein [Acidobacteriota bacterium]
MTQFTNLALAGLTVVIAAMFLLWLVSLARKDSSVVDPFWGPGFVGLTWLYFVLDAAPTGRQWLISTLVTVWGLRLGVYLLWRNWGEGEDFRYADMRRGWGRSFWWISLFQVFLLQGVLMWLIAAPILVIQAVDTPPLWRWTDVAGTLLWIVGLTFETVGDLQLARFKGDARNKGKVLDHGLWRYTRHPNYFGEAVLWWGYFLVALSVEGGLWTLVSPLLMTVLLLKVSGVSLLERSLRERRPEYRAYIERTSAFFPWPPAGDAKPR